MPEVVGRGFFNVVLGIALARMGGSLAGNPLK